MVDSAASPQRWKAAHGFGWPIAQNDKMTPVKLGKKMSDAFKNSTYVEIAQSGHMLPIEKPDEVNASIQNFLIRQQKQNASTKEIPTQG